MGVLGWLALATSACTDGGSYSPTVRFDPKALGEGVHTVEVALVTSCPEEAEMDAPPTAAIARTVITRNRAGAWSNLPAGTFGLHAIGRRNGDCQVIAAGCAPVRLKAGGSGELVVTLSAQAGVACDGEAMCNATTGECEDACAGGGCAVDAGSDRDLPEAGQDCNCPAVENGTQMCTTAGACVLSCEDGYGACHGLTACCADRTEEAIVTAAAPGGRHGRIAIDGPAGGPLVPQVVFGLGETPTASGELWHAARIGDEGGPWVASLVDTAAQAPRDLFVTGTGVPFVLYANDSNMIVAYPPSKDAWSEYPTGQSASGDADLAPYSAGPPQVGWRGGVTAYSLLLAGTWSPAYVPASSHPITGAALTGDFRVASAELAGAAAPYGLRVREAQWQLIGGVTHADSPNLDTFDEAPSAVLGDLEWNGTNTLGYVYTHGSELRYVRGRSTTWTAPETVLPTNSVEGSHFSLHETATRTVVSYLESDAMGTHVKAALRTGEDTWIHFHVALDVAAEGVTSLAIDRDDRLHVLYFSGRDQRPHYVALPTKLAEIAPLEE